MEWTIIKIFFLKVFHEKRFHKLRNIVNTLLPILITILIVSIANKGSNNKKKPEPEVFQPFDEDELLNYYPSRLENNLFFTPNNTFTYNIIEKVRHRLHIVYDRVQSFRNEHELEQELLRSKDYFAVLFRTKSNYSDLSYTIRTDNNNFRTTEVYSRDLHQSYLKDKNEYFDSGFLALQATINKEYLGFITGLNENLVHLEFEHVPKPTDNPQQSTSIVYFGTFIGIFFSVPYMFLVLLTIVEEKSFGFKEHLKIATKYSYYNEIAIAFINFCHFFIVFSICLVYTAFNGLWDGADLMLVFLLVFLFLLSFMSYTFFMSTFFDTVLIANICAPLFYFIPYLIEITWDKLDLFTIVAFPLNAFIKGIYIINSYKSSGHEFSWNDLFHFGYPGDDQTCMILIYMFLIIQTIMYLFLYYYVSNVRPGQYGTPKSLLFVFNNRNHKIDCCMNENSTMTRSTVSENCKHMKSVVNVKGLRKVFKFENQTKEAVKNVELDIYKHQITALLGHNGAGKTTTMNIIAGITPKTSGSICVDGQEDVDLYRSKLGFCPQHNVFLKYLTCQQHLKLFGTLRGLNTQEANTKAMEILENVGMIDKKDEFGDKLSGGMKRRLCLANAIIGETKILILDEPTSGLDPESRREIWDILLKLKKNHTILITTHFMEEADVLGDKIAIMEHGEIIAFGTSIFLKNHYGSGYILKLSKNAEFKQKEVEETLLRHVKGYERKESVDAVYCVTLPYSEMDKYVDLLKEFEDNRTELGIESLSITNTNLEEVFLKSSIDDRAIQMESDEIDSVIINAEEKSLESIKVDPKNLMWLQAWAIFSKKFIYTKRNWILTASLIAVPLTLTLVCFLSTNHSKIDYYDTVDLKYSSIKNPICYIFVHNYGGADEIVVNLKEKYKQSVDIRLLKDKDVHDHLIEQSEEDLIRYNDQIVSVLDFSPNETLKIMYSNNILHSIGISLNIATDFLLDYYGYDNSSIMVTNRPLTRQALINLYTPLLLTEAIPYGLMVFMLLFLQLPFIEFVTEFKCLQSIKSWLYWLTTFLYDYSVHFIVCLLVYGALSALDRDGVFTAGEKFHVFIICLIYGCIQLLLIYIISQSFNNLNSCITFLSYSMIFSIIASSWLLNSAENITKNSFWITILHLMPDFAVRNGLKTMYENQKMVKLEQVRFPEKTTYEIRASINGKLLGYADFYTMTLFMTVFYAIFLLFYIEKMYTKEKAHLLLKKIKRFYKDSKKTALKCRKPVEKECDTPDHNNDIRLTYEADVEIEKELVQNLIRDGDMKNEYSLIVQDLHKTYDELIAVDGLNIAVKRGECFGLLGMNGAGKTSTFKMMTKCDTITNGNVHIHDSRCRPNDAEYNFKFGYCPQTDALMGFMTSHEILNYLGKIKGISCQNIEKEVDKWLNQVDITNYKYTEIKFYSGGTKRKLNTALAMIGDPQVVFLDEPTTGVDPKSRRFVWKCIKDFQNNDQTIILTSHSMDECEELCNRLAIMVKGQLKCIGGIQKLKQKFGSGFSLLIKLKPKFSDAPEELKNKIMESFRCSLKDEHYGNLHYFVRGLTGSSQIIWSEIFAKLLELKAENADIIDNFSVNETTLEEIFLCFRPPTACDLLTIDICKEESVKVVPEVPVPIIPIEPSSTQDTMQPRSRADTRRRSSIVDEFYVDAVVDFVFDARR